MTKIAEDFRLFCETYIAAVVCPEEFIEFDGGVDDSNPHAQDCMDPDEMLLKMQQVDPDYKDMVRFKGDETRDLKYEMIPNVLLPIAPVLDLHPPPPVLPSYSESTANHPIPDMPLPSLDLPPSADPGPAPSNIASSSSQSEAGPSDLSKYIPHAALSRSPPMITPHDSSSDDERVSFS